MKRIMFNLLPAIFLWLGICCIASAQDPQTAQSDQIQAEGGEIIQDDDSDKGTFEPVIVDAFATSDVSLQFPANFANTPVVIQVLDGGALVGIDGESATIGADTMLSFSFQVSGQPGVHRVIVIDPNAAEDSPAIVALVRFEVPPATQ